MVLTTGDIQAIKDALRPDFERIDERFEQIDQRLAGMDQRLNSFQQEMNSRFDQVEQSLDTMGKEIAHNIIPLIVTQDQFGSLVKRVERLERQVQH